MSLYQKHRPRSFRTVIGNEQTIESLQNIVNKEEVPHAFLFTGQSGCGKTTVARILASAIGCIGQDYKEIDSAALRGIDTIRELRKQAHYKPLEGAVRVWLIDECHKMTNDAQNAFLKLLEDPPPHAYFILATTEPQKLISTIKSRCVIFEMKPLGANDMTRLLHRIAKKEKQVVSEEVVDNIIETMEGKPRAAIQVLEKVFSVADEKMRLQISKESVESQQTVINLVKALLKNAHWKTIAAILKELRDEDPESIRRGVLGYTCAIALNGKIDGKIGLIVEEFIEPSYDNGFNQIIYACMAVTNQ